MTFVDDSSNENGLTHSACTICVNAAHTTCQPQTCSLAASPASHIPEQGNEKEPTTLETCGPTSAVLLATYDHELSYWKMCQESFPLIEEQTANENPHMRLRSLVNLPSWGMTANGALYSLPTPERLTSESAGCLWPTPTATDNLDRKMSPSPHFTKNGTIRHINKDGQQSFLRLSQVVKYWATPMARDWRPGKASEETLSKNSRPLNEQVEAINHGPLNPAWDECLMGFPPGWTDPDGPPLKDRFSILGSRLELPASGLNTGKRELRPLATRLYRRSSTRLHAPYGIGYRRKTRYPVRSR
jgi:hypothetical protein